MDNAQTKRRRCAGTANLELRFRVSGRLEEASAESVVGRARMGGRNRGEEGPVDQLPKMRVGFHCGKEKTRERGSRAGRGFAFTRTATCKPRILRPEDLRDWPRIAHAEERDAP
ncbi:hypothetical protein B296_00050958 [Ensete ventricosum]|uniref:Uncharacterized protein n=1 Tax=Ensete ventricosum TaxID=4639 RepID=A0A426Y777_ENSVE|nr:hypothetical protein B296_00050958 [Ensete ventricosum]